MKENNINADRLVKISDYKMICENDDILIFSNGNRLYKKIGKNEMMYIGSITLTKKYNFLQRFRLCQRMFRIDPKCGIFIDKNTALISMRGAVYKVSLLHMSIEKEFDYRKSMNNPISFCQLEELDGFDDGIYYGEYFGNPEREKVCIYRRSKDGKWDIAYAFPPGTIQHIHRILVHPIRKSVIVLTGDKDEESAIWEFRDNFRKVTKLIGGKQFYRSCVAFPYSNGIIYATDTPLEKNSIYFLDLSKITPVCNKICDISGPSIFGTVGKDGTMYFSTSVEPDSSIKPYFRYMISYKLGPGVRDRYSRIYAGNLNTGFRKIAMEKKDKFPMLLFGFGTFLFPNSKSGKIYISGQSLEKSDAKTYLLKG